MSDKPADLVLARLFRGALALSFGVLMIGLAGAASPSRLPRREIVHVHGPSNPLAMVPAGVELLHADEALPAAPELAPAQLPSLSGPHVRTVRVLVTAYCGCTKCCGPNARGLTASGLPISYNGGQFVAADTRLFRFGTLIRIPGYAGGQPVEVVDRGGAIKGYHLDVFFPTHEEAREWGRKWIDVTIDE